MRRSRILLVVVVVALAIVGLGLLNMRFHITGTTPETKAVSTISPFIDINFNKQLSSSGLVVSGSANLVKNYHATGKKIRVDLQYPLQEGKTYIITVVSVHSQSGDSISNRTIRFTAKNLDYSQLTPDQQKALVAGQDKDQGVHNDPIASHLPHSTLDYNLTGEVDKNAAGQDELVLNADLLLSNADVNTGKDAAIATYKQEVISYIQSLGFDPAKYTIRYNVVLPS